MPSEATASSDHEFFGPMIPRIIQMLRERRYDEATEAFWQIQPAGTANGALAAQLHGGAFINRQAWTFQAWLQGYNGGPLRHPTQRIHDCQMTALRRGCSTRDSS